MDQSLYVDPDELRNSADELRTLAAETERRVATLKAALADAGECWGDDAPGKAIAASYVPGVRKNMKGFDNLVQNIETIGSNLRTMAENFENQDLDGGNDVRDSLPDPLYPNYPDLGNAPWNEQPDQATEPNRSSPVEQQSQQHSEPSSAGSPAPEDTGGAGAQQPAQQQLANAPTDPDSPGRDSGNNSGSSDPNDTGSEEAGGNQQQIPSQPATSGPGSAAAPPAGSAPWSSSPSPSSDRKTGSGPTATPSARSPGSRDASTPASQNSRVPWSKPGTGATPENQSPPRVSPPRRPTTPKKAPEPKQRKSAAPKKAPKKAPKPVTADEAMQILTAMAARHSLRISGFEASGISTQTAQEIADAVDTVLTKYALSVRGIAVEDGGGDLSRMENRSQAAAPEPWIVLDHRAATNPGILSGRDRPWTETRPGADGRRPMHTTMLRELGSVVDLAGGFRARPTAQRALITEYLRVTGAEGRTLAQVTDGYRRWRDQLGEYCFRDGVLDPGRALSAGFATVVQGGVQAPGPAKVLHRLLLTMARLDMR